MAQSSFFIKSVVANYFKLTPVVFGFQVKKILEEPNWLEFILEDQKGTNIILATSMTTEVFDKVEFKGKECINHYHFNLVDSIFSCLGNNISDSLFSEINRLNFFNKVEFLLSLAYRYKISVDKQKEAEKPAEISISITVQNVEFNKKPNRDGKYFLICEHFDVDHSFVTFNEKSGEYYKEKIGKKVYWYKKYNPGEATSNNKIELKKVMEFTKEQYSFVLSNFTAKQTTYIVVEEYGVISIYIKRKI